MPRLVLEVVKRMGLEGKEDSGALTAESRLRESEERLRLVMACLTEQAVLMLDAHGMIQTSSVNATRLTGYTAGELVGLSLLALCASGLGEEGAEAGRSLSLLTVNDIYETTVTLACKNGSRPITSIKLGAVRVYDQIVGYTVVLAALEARRGDHEHDVTVGARQGMGSLSDALPLILWVADAAGAVQSFNARWSEVTGLSQNDSLGEGWLAALHPDDRVDGFERWQASVTSGEPFQAEHRLLAKNGGCLWTMCMAVPVYEDQKIVKWLGANVDISDRHRAEDELRQAKDMAEQANRTKSAFLANMSHEIRTPLNAIMGFSELLREEGLSPEEQEHFLTVIHRNGENLSILINDILDLSKVEADKLLIENIPLSLASLLADVTTSLSVAAQQKNITLRTSLSPSLPKVIVSDPTRLHQILINIVGNAIKFTDRGRVDIKVEWRTDPREKNPRVEFKVSDTGCGISEAARKRLFLPFSQADNSTTRQYGGTGLGLILSRKLARLLGGDVVLSGSHLGLGSVFTVSIAACSTMVADSKPHVKRQEDIPYSLQGVRILLAEDTPDNQILTKRILERCGAHVTIVNNGRAAVQAALAHPYDLILMDVQMPELDGYGATSQLRKEGYRAPIITLTAYAMADQREKCLKLGANAHLTKPIAPRELIEAVMQVSRMGETATRPHWKH